MLNFIKKRKCKFQGEYLAIALFFLTIGIYGIFFGSFISWWGYGLSRLQVVILTLISMIVGMVYLAKLIFGIFRIKEKKYKLKRDVAISLILWVLLLFLFFLTALQIINIPAIVILIIFIIFAVYISKVVENINLYIGPDPGQRKGS